MEKPSLILVTAIRGYCFIPKKGEYNTVVERNNRGETERELRKYTETGNLIGETDGGIPEIKRRLPPGQGDVGPTM